MVDFDELRSKAEALLGEHSDQVDDGIDKLADLAGKRLGHSAQVDQAAAKLKGFVADQKQSPAKNPPGKKATGKKATGRPPAGG
jgi:hypothetical protein